MADISLAEYKIGLLIQKTSNFWQSNLRKILSQYGISLNEYLVLQSTQHLLSNNLNIYQNEIVDFSGINISVVSVTLKLLEKKNHIVRISQYDNRKKNIQILKSGNILYNKVHPLVQRQEELIFSKLNKETFNFTNSLKLLLGKKIRIKAKKENLNDRTQKS